MLTYYAHLRSLSRRLTFACPILYNLSGNTKLSLIDGAQDWAMREGMNVRRIVFIYETL